jgi:hypothetical protein
MKCRNCRSDQPPAVGGPYDLPNSPHTVEYMCRDCGTTFNYAPLSLPPHAVVIPFSSAEQAEKFRQAMSELRAAIRELPEAA